MPHLSDEDLALYVGGSASNAAVDAVAAHVESCEACREQVVAAMRAQRAMPQAPREEIAVGATIGRYVVCGVRGSGAMSHVLEAEDPALGRTIALKIVRGLDSAGDERALREGRALARLAHPNVVSVFDVGTWSGGVFLAIELIDGVSVREWARTPRSPREIARVFAAVARGLAAAHRAGLVHRDVKPDNLVLDANDRVRVIDFGLAIESDSESQLGGTPAYFAPEQRAKGTADARSDQYAFMVSLFETLEGKRPEGPMKRRVPGWLRAIVERGLRVDPTARYPDMDAVAKALERGLAIRNRVGVAVGAVALAAAGVTGIVLARGGDAAAPSPCKGASDQLAAVWNAPRKQAIASAFEATKQPFAADAWRGVEQRIDRYGASWVAMRTEACEATRVRGEQSEELLDLRIACLRTRLVELRSLADLFAAADATLVSRAATAAGSLASLDECADGKALLAPVRPPRDPRAASLEDQLAVTRAQLAAGKLSEAIESSEAAVEAARKLDHAPTLARALFALGAAQHGSGDREAAEPTLREAVRAAEAGRLDTIKADALIVLFRLVGETSARVNEAIALAEDARAVVLRLDNDQVREARRLDNLGDVLRNAGRLDEALAAHRSAVAIRERLAR